jgi:nitroimidazol reductase NimA-like FMN-containing flavoprotein (pyridoxamine 5'-phosphate oxidase superfamily)
MTHTETPVTVLDTDKAWDILAGQRLGRLGIAGEDGIDIFPVNYVVSGESIVFRTAEGTKLSRLRAASRVSFEADTWTEHVGFSVIAKGQATVVADPAEVRQLEALRLRSWIATVKTVYIRLDVTTISARRFAFGPEPVN